MRGLNIHQLCVRVIFSIPDNEDLIKFVFGATKMRYRLNVLKLSSIDYRLHIP